MARIVTVASDPTAYAYIDYNGTATDTASGGFPARGNQNVELSISYEMETVCANPAVDDADAYVEYQFDGGGWVEAAHIGPDPDYATDTYNVSLGAVLDMSTIQARVRVVVNEQVAATAESEILTWSIAYRVPSAIIEA